MSLLPYTIAACSSEDEQHPARELQSFHSQSRGWQSAHFCDFPQELMLRFGAIASVQQVQLLSHQFKIATRVELFIGKLAPGVSEPPARGTAGVSFTRLGHFSLDGNERSKFQARELKTVYVPRLAEGHFLRLLLHRCHVNEHNLYNQVGVLAIRVVGTGGVDVSGEGDASPPHGIEPLLSMAERPPPSAENGPQRAPAIDGGVMGMLQDLFAAKDAAVGAEDYEEAKRLKVAIEELRAVGVRLCELERKKIAAVAREDYDAAKVIKDELQNLRASAGVPIPLPPPPPPHILPADLSPYARRPGRGGGNGVARHPSESDDPSRDCELQAAQDRINRMAQQAMAPSSVGRGEEYVPPHRQPAEGEEEEEGGLPLPESPVVEPPAGVVSHEAGERAAVTTPVSARSGVKSKRTPEASRKGGNGRLGTPPAHAPKVSSASPRAPKPPAADDSGAARRGAANGFLGGVRRATNQREHDERPIGAARPPPPEATSSAEASDDAPTAEPLSAAARKEATANGLLELFGEELVAGIYSRTWSARQAAMTKIASVFPTKTGHKRALMAGAVRVMLLGAGDKMVNVFLASLEVVTALLSTPLSALCSAADAERELRPLLERWREKLADSNARVREGAENGLLALCSASEIGPAVVGALLAAPLPPSKRNSTQAWVGRLAPLKRLLREHGGAVPQLVTPALKMVKEALGSASGQVSASMRPAHERASHSHE
jgi:centrosomal protein CEP104